MSSSATRLAPDLTTSALAIGRNRDGGGGCRGCGLGARGRTGVGDRHSADEIHALAFDRQYAHRVVGAICHERQRPGPVNRHSGRLLAGLDRTDLDGWRGGEVDHIDLVVWYTLPALAVFDPVERVGDQG